MKVQVVDLKHDWRWKERNTEIENVWDESTAVEGWSPVLAGMPSEIHVELMKAKRIPDPYIGFNEHKVQWVGEREWLYSSIFAFEKNANEGTIELVFEGLDTFCSVYLNQKLVLDADNQFREHRVKTETGALEANNTLLLHFKSAKQVAKELEKRYGRVRAGSCNLGHPSRVYARKAQYDWRWDWGPELLTVGPYRPIRLLAYTAYMVDLHPLVTVSKDLTCALVVEMKILGDTGAVKIVQVVLRDPKGNVVKREEVISTAFAQGEDKEIIRWHFEKDEVKLWWPTGYGDQMLYEVEVIIIGENSSILDQQKKRFGFRSVRLVQEPLEEADRYGKGATFLFEVNGIRMFMGGSNWIPADSFLTTVTPDRYRSWLQLIKDGNQNMVRLWGGGVYELDVFYDICDELGILVWQDFQFACGVYPAHDEFVENVRLEAEYNVRRLRHHPCMALFCGNNEDYQQVLQWGDVVDLPARKIYEQILPDVVTALTQDNIPYHRGSPYGGQGWDTADPTVGDIHQWDVWAGPKIYHDYDILGGRFVRTVDYWLGGCDEKQRYAQSKLMAQHDRAGSHERRFAICMNDNFRLTADLETLPARSYGKLMIVGRSLRGLSQTILCVLRHRARLKPITVGIFRAVQKSRECDRPRQFYDFGTFPCVSANVDVWATNATLKPRSVTLELTFIDLQSDWTFEESRKALLEPNQTTEILKMLVPEPPSSPNNELAELEPQRSLTHTVVISARLLDTQSKEVLSRMADWPLPYRFLEFPEPGLRVQVLGEQVIVSAKKPAKGVVLSIGDDDSVSWSDNGFDVMPGDPQEITAKGLKGRKLRIAYMGKENAHEIDE